MKKRSPDPDMDTTRRGIEAAAGRLVDDLGSRLDVEQLFPLVYDDLRRLARRQMAGERAGHTLQATALVHEAYLRVTGGAPMRWEDRVHLFRTVARAMRRVLIDRARHRGSDKAGGAWQRVDQAPEPQSDGGVDRSLALAEALEALEGQHPRLAAVVELRYFAGCSVAETAALLQVTERTVTRDWTAARAWLFRSLTGDHG